jgi:hypothetical protein
MTGLQPREPLVGLFDRRVRFAQLLHIGLLRGDPCHQRSTTHQTLSGPVLLAIVVLKPWRQNHPGLFGRSENVYVRRQAVRFVERSDADKSYGRPCARVVAPDGDAALGAAGDLLAFTTLSVLTTSGSAPSSVTPSASIIAFRAKDAPVSRWHQRQWQQ